MPAEPGFGGQTLMEDMMPKVHWLRTQFLLLDIEVDGGLSPDTIHTWAKTGANIIVFGGATIRSEAPRSVINWLKYICSEASQNHSLHGWTLKELIVPAPEISVLLEHKNVDYQVILNEAVLLFWAITHSNDSNLLLKCTKRLEIEVYTYIFSDGIERLVWRNALFLLETWFL